MKNTWLHSILLIAIGTLILVLVENITSSTIQFVADRSSSPQAIISLFAAPGAALAKLAPGLLLGWFTRRHPLVLGAFAGALAPLFAQQVIACNPGQHLLVGAVLATSFTVAVAALAGRALRYRYQPSNHSITLTAE